MQANSGRHNYFSFIWPLIVENMELNGREKEQKYEYLENEKSFVD